jgi:hypothetical protein
MSTFVFSPKHKGALDRPLVGGRCNANVPFHLPDALERHQLRMTSNGIAMAVQAGLGWGGGSHRENVYAACRGGVVGLSLMTWTIVETFLNTR